MTRPTPGPNAQNHEPSPFNVSQYQDEYGPGVWGFIIAGRRQPWIIAKGVPRKDCSLAGQPRTKPNSLQRCVTPSYVFIR